MKGNNEIREALIYWPANHPSKEALGTAKDWTAMFEIKGSNNHGSPESLLVGLIDKWKINKIDNFTEIHVRYDADDCDSIKATLSQLFSDQETVDFCTYFKGNCFAYPGTLADFNFDDGKVVINVYREPWLEIWPSGLDVDFNFSGVESGQTDFETLIDHVIKEHKSIYGLIPKRQSHESLKLVKPEKSND